MVLGEKHGTNYLPYTNLMLRVALKKTRKKKSKKICF